MSGWDDPVGRIRELERQVSAARAAIDREEAGGCHHGHQQGETNECNACTASRIGEALDAAGPGAVKLPRPTHA